MLVGGLLLLLLLLSLSLSLSLFLSLSFLSFFSLFPSAVVVKSQKEGRKEGCYLLTYYVTLPYAKVT